MSSVKRGLTGEKNQSTDEFLVKKKNPLVMPPDYANLPTPDERAEAQEEISNFEKTLETAIEDASLSEEVLSSSSVEDSIIKKIQKK